MEKKTLIIIFCLIIAVLGIVLGLFSIKGKNIKPAGNELTNQQNTNTIIKDDFSINAPEGWLETKAPLGASLMVVKKDENVTDPAAKKINFQSYFAVSYDVLQGDIKEKYIKTLKNNLTNSIPGTIFTKEEKLMVDGHEAEALEAELNQQGVDFNILMVLIKGNGNDVWVISFNTTRDKWNAYKDLFYQIVNSFKLK